MDKTKKKKILNIISDTILGVIFGVVVVLAGASIISKTTNRVVLPYNMMWVKSDSMEPTFKKNSYILTKKIDGDDVKEGDIVTFIVKNKFSLINGSYNTHEVIGIDENNKLITKGVNNELEDTDHVDRSDVVAIYKRNMPVMTFFGRLFTTTAGYILTILVISGGTIIWFTIDLKDKKKVEKQKLMDELLQEEIKKLEEESKNKKD